MPQALFVPAKASDLSLSFAPDVDTAPFGSVLYKDSDLLYHALGPGIPGQFLRTNGGAGVDPAWNNLSASDLAPTVILAPGSSARNVIQPTGDFVPLALKAFGTPSVNRLELQDSTGAVKASVDANCQFDTTANTLIGNASMSCWLSNDMTNNNLYVASNAFFSSSLNFWQKAVAARSAIFGSAGTGISKGFYVYTSDSTTPGNITDFTERFSVRSDGRVTLTGALIVGVNSTAFETMLVKSTATNLVALRARAFSSSSTSNVIEVQNATPVNLFQVSPAGLTTTILRDATTNVISDALIIDHATSGTPAAGFGQQLRFKGQSSTTVSRNVGLFSSAWVVATDASRTGRMRAWASDATADRECIRWETDGTNAMVGFLGANAVVRQAGASAAGIAAITDANARTAVGALQTALANLGLITSPA